MGQFSYYFFIMLLTIFTFTGCTDFDYKVEKYIVEHCDFEDYDTCFIDIKDIINIDFDTLFIFDGYSLPESVTVIAEGDTNIVSEGDFIYGSEIDKIVCVKNKKIIYQAKWQHKSIWLESEGVLVEKDGIFDGKKGLIYEADMYLTSKFKIVRVKEEDNIYYRMYQ